MRTGPFVARLEKVTRIDQYGFWMTGWVQGARPAEIRLTAVSPEGARCAVPPEAVTFHPRPGHSSSVQEDDTIPTLGFHALVESTHPSRHPRGWVLELGTEGGEAVRETASAPVSGDVAEVSEQVLDVVRGRTPDEATFTHLVLPALARLRGGSHEGQIERLVDFGAVTSSPAISIVIAVRRMDRIQDQLAQFVRDPHMGAAEIIFVAPRGRGGAELATIAEELHLLYGLPFRALQLSRPVRRPRALNLGASVANGSHLVLMSGDVLPRAPGWAVTMREFFDRAPSIAAVGAKLLHEDDSIAHAGVTYVRRGAPSRWRATATLAGLGRTSRAAGFSRPVDAVSDACMMVTAERFRTVGGFSELYLGAGDEAGDLCMMLAENEGQIWYVADAELYNLDRPDTPAKRSPAGSRFNDWLFTERWGARLAWGMVDETGAA